MRDKRSVDELSIAELERILAIRRREARQERLRHLEAQGRRLPAAPVADPVPSPPPPLDPQQHEAAEDLEPVEPPVTYDITDELPRFEDEVEVERLPRRKPERPAATGPHAPRQRGLWDKVLLGVEILGVIGIVAVLVFGGYLVINENDKIEALEKQSAQIQRDAEAMRITPTPAPELSIRLADYVLPGGHKYQDGVGVFNLDELPESIRPAAVQLLNVAPQAEIVERPPSAPARIQIPRIGVDNSIYAGDDWYQLQKGVGHFPGSANPGERGNLVLSAHNDIFGEIFRYLPQLEPGDEIRVQAKNGQWYTYIVREGIKVNPDDTWVLAQGNDSITTLITCYPYRVDTHRWVVFAELVED